MRAHVAPVSIQNVQTANHTPLRKDAFTCLRASTRRREHWKTGLCLLFAVCAGTCFSLPAYAQQPETFTRSLTLEAVIETALEQNPAIQLQEEQVQIESGRQRIAGDPFDVRFQASASGTRTNNLFVEPGGAEAVDVVGRASVNVASYRIEFAKQFHSGLLVQPYVSVEQTNTLNSELAAANRSTVGLQVTVPLLEGRGANVVAADLRAAREGVDASRIELRVTMAETAYRAAQAYWSYVAAGKLLDIARESEERATTLVEETTVLVENDERPAADLEQLRANLATRTAARIGAEQALVEAKHRLGLAIGLQPEAIDELTVASGEFPSVGGQTPADMSTTSFVAMALERRDELAAVKLRQQAAGIQLSAARDRLKPRLDLSLDVGYVGLEQGNGVRPLLAPFGPDAGGLNASLTLSSDLSFQNHEARGLMAQREAAYQQQLITENDLKRTISVNVGTAVSALMTSTQQVARAEEAVELSRSVVENEKKKFQLGMSTLFDVILAEDRLTSALQGYVQSRLRHAVALASLRFETGTMLTFRDGEAVVNEERFTTIPPTDIPEK